MARSIRIDQLANEITRCMREYTEEVSAEVEKEVDEAAKRVLRRTKELAPKRTGAYARGFVSTNKSLPGNRRYVVWNKKHYQRVHLLEMGHAKAKGGEVAAIPHLRPAHEQETEEMLARIRRVLRRS